MQNHEVKLITARINRQIKTGPEHGGALPRRVGSCHAAGDLHLGAGYAEHREHRPGGANGDPAKQGGSPAGAVAWLAPGTRDTATPFDPPSRERRPR
jgi:hypothetical protein